MLFTLMDVTARMHTLAAATRSPAFTKDLMALGQLPKAVHTCNDKH